MIRGDFDPPAIGRMLFPSYQNNGDGTGSIKLIAQSDASGAVSPCFAAWLPHIHGRIVRLSCIPIFGAMTTATATATLTDTSGATWTGTVTTAGNKDTLVAVSSWLSGRLRLSFDTFGAPSKQLEVAIHVMDAIQTASVP